jgi:hypothetical protein
VPRRDAPAARTSPPPAPSPAPSLCHRRLPRRTLPLSRAPHPLHTTPRCCSTTHRARVHGPFRRITTPHYSPTRCAHVPARHRLLTFAHYRCGKWSRH